MAMVTVTATCHRYGSFNSYGFPRLQLFPWFYRHMAPVVGFFRVTRTTTHSNGRHTYPVIIEEVSCLYSSVMTCHAKKIPTNKQKSFRALFFKKPESVGLSRSRKGTKTGFEKKQKNKILHGLCDECNI